MPSIVELKDYATMLGVLVGAISLVFTAYNTRVTSLSTRARFWLDLRSQFARHDEVHRRLRPGGQWSDGSGPSSSEEWAQAEAYMGLFEHCEIMLTQRLIDERTFKEIYGYRLHNLVANDHIRTAKLIQRSEGWLRFLDLTRRLEIPIQP